MRIEDIKYEFPEMPEEIKSMVKREVEKQLHTADAANRRRTNTGNGNETAAYTGRPGTANETAAYTDRFSKKSQTAENAGSFSSRTTGAGSVRKRRMSARRAAVIGLAAAIALGTTAFAGSRLYKMYGEQLGNYGAKTLIAGEETTADTGNSSAIGTATGKEMTAEIASGTEIPDVKLKMNYLPEGMTRQPFDPLKFHYESDAELQGGISICAYSMDTGDDSFQVTDTDILSREEINSSGRDIIYLEKQRIVSGGTQGIVYVFFPEVHHVLQMWCGPDVSKEEAVKVAEGIELIPAADGETSDIGLNWAWSSYLETQQETELTDDFYGRRDTSLQKTGTAHTIGETFSLPCYCYDEKGELTNTDCITTNVVSVQTADDLSLLGDSEYIDSKWLSAVDDTGKLLPNEIQYIKSGDGINTLDEVVKTEQIPQKLVYATIDYTNTGDTVLKDVSFFVSLVPICEDAEEYKIYDRAAQAENADWDRTEDTGAVLYSEMQFYDYHSSGDHNGSNYIDVLNPGETVTIHVAWIANEDELQYLYLNFNSDSYDPSGFVDIRQ